MSGSKTGTPIVADTRQLARLARNIRAASPEAWKACRVALRAAVEPVAADARSRAGYSSRIPGSIRTRVTGGGNVKIVAGGAKAPEAAPLENKGQQGTFRHPVFARKDQGRSEWTWVQQRARPFLGPAADAGAPVVAEKVLQAVADAVARVLKGGEL